MANVVTMEQAIDSAGPRFSGAKLAGMEQFAVKARSGSWFVYAHTPNIGENAGTRAAGKLAYDLYKHGWVTLHQKRNPVQPDCLFYLMRRTGKRGSKGILSNPKRSISEKLFSRVMCFAATHGETVISFGQRFGIKDLELAFKRQNNIHRTTISDMNDHLKKHGF